MSYSQFKTIAEVAKKFDIEVTDKAIFVSEKEINISDYLVSMLIENMNDNVSFTNEITICERIISPILNAVSRQYKDLNVWSHVPYNIDEKQGLVGEPDYLVAARNKYGSMEKPALCVIEAKRDDFELGWAQALAEMVASSLVEDRIYYGVVTTGKLWEFGKLEQGVFTIDSKSISAMTDLQKTFNYLNWVFNQISKKS